MLSIQVHVHCQSNKIQILQQSSFKSQNMIHFLIQIIIANSWLIKISILHSSWLMKVTLSNKQEVALISCTYTHKLFWGSRFTTITKNKLFWRNNYITIKKKKMISSSDVFILHMMVSNWCTEVALSAQKLSSDFCLPLTAHFKLYSEYKHVFTF